MTDPTTDETTIDETEDDATTTVTDETTAASEPETTDEAETADEADNPNHEAAKYRRRLREAEDQVQALTEANTAMRRVVLLAAGDFEVTINDEDTSRHGRFRLDQPTDLLDLGGLDLADLVDEAGTVNQERIHTAMAELHAKRPGLFSHRVTRPPTQQPRPREWYGGSDPTEERVSANPMAEALTPRNKR